MSNVPVELVAGFERDVGEHLLLEREQSLRADVEPHPGLGRLDAPARAVEQLRPEPLLERAHLQADRRLRHAEPLGGLRERAPLDDGAEGCKLTGVHREKRESSRRRTHAGTIASGCLP